jgi:hypothetical protein
MEQDERRVVELLRNKGLIAKEFSSEEKRSKTPDFRVFKGDEFVFFCEVKSIPEDPWLKNQVQKAEEGTIVGNRRNDPKFNRVSNKIHEAAAQFNSVNINRDIPNVLVFVSKDYWCKTEYLVWVLTGYFQSDNGNIHHIFKKYSRGRISKDKQLIDSYIWMNVKDDQPIDEFDLFCWSDSRFLPKIAGLFSLTYEVRESEKSILRWRVQNIENLKTTS